MAQGVRLINAPINSTSPHLPTRQGFGLIRLPLTVRIHRQSAQTVINLVLGFRLTRQDGTPLAGRRPVGVLFVLRARSGALGGDWRALQAIRRVSE